MGKNIAPASRNPLGNGLRSHFFGLLGRFLAAGRVGIGHGSNGSFTGSL